MRELRKLSLIDRSRLQRDPRKLAYLYPRMPVTRYKAQTEEYYHDITIKTVEDVAKMAGLVIVPASCVHHKRREASKRIFLFGRSYYVRKIEDLTPIELAKYKEQCTPIQEVNG